MNTTLHQQLRKCSSTKNQIFYYKIVAKLEEKKAVIEIKAILNCKQNLKNVRDKSVMYKKQTKFMVKMSVNKNAQIIIRNR